MARFAAESALERLELDSLIAGRQRRELDLTFLGQGRWMYGLCFVGSAFGVSRKCLD